MSHFYGTLQGARGEATRAGSKGSGIETYAASWKGAIRVNVFHDETSGVDRYAIHQTRWHGAGVDEEIASGALGVSIAETKREAELAKIAEESRAREAVLSQELPDEFYLVKAMKEYGGSFASNLAAAWQRADLSNQRLLRAQFSGLLESYRPYLDKKAA
jgi:hypothetical protein